MTYEDLIVLVPCHSLEDFPTELPDDQAASVLNSWVVPWHPRLIAAAGVVPRWHRADDPPEVVAKKLVMLPTKCKDRVPAGWVDRVRNEGATVVTDCTERADMLKAALAPLGDETTVDPDLAADFLALGFCYLQIELLTRHMRNFSSLDEVHLQRETVAAAQAAVEGRNDDARAKLKGCFEVLTEARERFYPVECYLIDLCLVIPETADQHLKKSLHEPKPFNVLLAGTDLEKIAAEHPDVITALREACLRGSVGLIGGERQEAPTPLLPPESVLWQFIAGRHAWRHTLGQVPVVWGRRRFGLFPQMPQILHRFGYQGALHVAMDDGLYPDQEHSKVRWEGTNGSVLDALSRIPLAADGANSYLRFPVRLSESMDNDHVAAVIFARWPEVKAPWFEDLRRMRNYSSVLGRWITLDEFFQHTDHAGRHGSFDINEYLTPFLVQSVARDEADSISRYARHFERRSAYDSAHWLAGMSRALRGVAVDDPQALAVEEAVELGGPEGDAEKQSAVETTLREYQTTAGRLLADVVVGKSGDQPGYLVVNTLSFPRTVSVSLPDLTNAPAAGEIVKHSQVDETRRLVTLQLPGCGFAWLPRNSPPAPPPAKPARGKEPPPMAEPHVVRNELFEVYLNEQTGGVAQIKGYGRVPNRLSCQLAYRFPRERVVSPPDDFEVKSYYSQMRRTETQVRSMGPALGEVVTLGMIEDQTNGEKLADFQQTLRIYRGRPVVEVDFELDVVRQPDGDPWTNYYAVRFAWNDSTAVLTRSVMGNAQSVKVGTGWGREARFESPLFVEIASETERTTILTGGLPFHRQTGDRMLDTLLIVAGETRRKFSFTVALDQSYPMQPALDALVPAAVVPTPHGPPRFTTGWFLNVAAKNVQLTRLLDRLAEHSPPAESGEHATAPALPAPGFAVRLMETEGRPVRTHLRCFRTPTRARQRDFQGKTLSELTIEGDAVVIDLTAFETADVEVSFAPV